MRKTTRFFNLATIDFDLNSMGASKTPEKGHFHAWDDRSGTNDETLGLVGICKDVLG